MGYLLGRWLVLTVTIWITARFLPGMTVSGGLEGLVIVAAVLGLINAIIRPVVVFFTCPLIVLTLGLFTLIINALMLSLTNWLLPMYLSLDSFWTTLIASVIISIVSGLLSIFVHDHKD